ncbi:hypothetical protein AAHE18_04G075700 [Arachis hypogaea]
MTFRGAGSPLDAEADDEAAGTEEMAMEEERGGDPFSDDGGGGGDRDADVDGTLVEGDGVGEAVRMTHNGQSVELKCEAEKEGSGSVLWKEWKFVISIVCAVRLE